jgi:hypothetical protein
MLNKKIDNQSSDWKEIWSRITDEKPSEVVKMLKEAQKPKAS